MSLTWEDEPYVKVFLRDTPEFKAMSYHARTLFFALLRKVSRAGTLSVGRLGLRGVAVAVEGPWPFLEEPLQELLDDGCVAFDATAGVVVIPNFMKAQETPQSDAARKRASRERARSVAVDGSRPVTPSHAQSPLVPLRKAENSINREIGAGAREEQEECQNGRTDPENRDQGDARDFGGRAVAGTTRAGDASDDPSGRRMPAVEQHPDDHGPPTGAVGGGGASGERDGQRAHGGSRGTREPAPLTAGPSIDAPDDPECLLPVLARLVASGDPWARDVEERRQERLGRLSDREKGVLRKARDRDGPRPTVTAQDEADVQAIVEAHVQGHQRILADKAYVALTADWSDARRLLPDLRLLREQRKVAASPAEIVAHKLERYMRDPKNNPFPLRWLLDRTEQDDLPRPKKPAAPERAPPAGFTSRPAARRAPTVEEQAEIDRRKSAIVAIVGKPEVNR